MAGGMSSASTPAELGVADGAHERLGGERGHAPQERRVDTACWRK